MSRQFNSKYILGDWETGQAAAGTTGATATTLTADHNWVATVTAAARGVILKSRPPGSFMSVTNADSADNLFVYPWSGANFNGGTTDDYIMIPSKGTAWFFVFSSTKISAVAFAGPSA
jgi:hypothetical protein